MNDRQILHGSDSGRKYISMVNTYEKLKFHRDNKGEALAMVIIIITFISILAGVLMFVAYAGYVMRTVDRQGKDNFYTAETVLDEINVGLQGEISEALAKAYEEVMTNYASYPNASERNKALRTLYFDALKEKLEKSPSESNYYDDDLLRTYLSGGTDGVLGDGDGTRGNFGSYGAIVESNLGTDDDPTLVGIRYQMEANNTRLLLKDLKVSYVNRNGYVSIISTDIRIDLPSFNFSQAAELPALDSCSMIADDTLYMGNSAAGGNIVIKGDAYAGQMFVGTPYLGHADNKVYSALDKEQELSLPTLLATGVSFENAVSVDAVNMSLVVSRQNIEVSEGSTLKTDNTELWGQNLTVDSASAELDGNINFKDDLTLAGTNSRTALSGEYNGFGYLVSGSNADSDSTGGGSTEEGDEEDGTAGNAYSSPNASSSIVINGRNSTLDLSGLQRMTISGRAYVATAYDGSSTATDDEKKNKVNVMMGESVAVKSNQLIYLVPGEALGCRIEQDGTIGESEYNCNPFTLEQYEEIINHPTEYVLLDGSRNIPTLGYKSLSNYINQETIAGGQSAYVPEIVFRQTNAGTLVYCYLRFADEDAANRYFRDYYNLNAEYVDRYTKLYAQDIKMSDDLLYLNIAGNMLAYAGEDNWSVISSTDSSGNRAQAQRIASIKDDTFTSLSAKLVRTSNQLTDAELGRTAFNNIIDEVEVENILDAKFSGSVTITTLDGADSVWLTRNDCTVNGSTTADMVVCLGDVTVTGSYRGLIIAKGSIIVEAGDAITIEPIDADTFSNLLLTKIDDLSESDSDSYYLMNIFTDGISYATSGNTAFDVGTSRVSLVDLISYERWLKK